MGALGLSSAWWDKVLDGNVYRLIPELLPTRKSSEAPDVVQVRAAAFREAHRRRRNLHTALCPIVSDAVLVQVWRNWDDRLDLKDPSLLAARMPVPLLAYSPDLQNEARIKLVLHCTCDPTHEASCATQPKPDPNLDDWDDDDLLGPCTCGQAPSCLPSCSRAG